MRNEVLKTQWNREIVEDQNSVRPPKIVLQEIFRECDKSYRETIHGVEILARTHYQLIAERCPQCFKPFVDYLEGLTLAN